MKVSTAPARVFIAMALAISLAACVTTLGRNFDDAYAQQIKPGETTKTEVLQKLGRPALHRAAADEETWTYAHYTGGGIRSWFTTSNDDLQEGTGRQKRLVVVFKGDVVKSSKYTLEIPQQ